MADLRSRLTDALGPVGVLEVKRIEGDLVSANCRLFARTPRPAGFVGALSRHGIGCLTFHRGVTTDELHALCAALAADCTGDSNVAVRRRLVEDGVSHIDVDELAVSDRSEGSRLRWVSATELYNSALDAARQAVNSARLSGVIDVKAAEAVVEEMLEAVARDPAMVLGLSVLKGHDEYSFTHSVHTSLLSLVFGSYVGLTTHELRGLAMSAMLHDIGKSVIPLEILRKPGKLSDPEWELMRRHPIDGALLLLDCDDLPTCAPAVALEHHLRADLSGYPRLRRRREVSFLSLLVSLTDVYDALTTQRPYRPPLTPDAAAAEMESMASTHTDPRLARWFREMLGGYPPGTCVVLDSGEAAIVCRTDPDHPEHPDVVLVTDACGVPLTGLRDVSLAEAHNGTRRSIVRSIPPTDLKLEPSVILDGWLARTFPAGDGPPEA
jgi:HD-GYP domain-containing protein (c-di-GMP phosphodiesterase class II)